MVTATAGGAGFSHKAAATGPNAGIDPIMSFRKKMQKRKKKLKEDRVNPAPRSRLFQYKVSIPEVGDTVIYANSPSELAKKMRLLINPRYRGDVKIERIMPAKAAEFFMDKRTAHMKNIDTAGEANKRLYATEDKKMQQDMAQGKIAIEKKKVLLKKQALQKQLQAKVADLKKKVRVGGVKVESDS